ncbi:RNA polymerase sigma-70 factor OS=Streptomyces griseomycini OX=66895 GN=FHS37_002663 PE=3 SV=1 [Streptomyces griseomycini]
MRCPSGGEHGCGVDQQHVHRARTRIAAERRRGSEEVDPASARRVVEEFLAAAASGRTERLVTLLTDDVTAVSDGAGRARRLLRFTTRERVASYVRAGFRPTPAKRRLAGGSPTFHVALVNGSPAVLAVVGDRVVGAVAFEVGDGRVASLCGIAAADRLARLNEAWRQHGSDAPVVAAW